VLLAIFGCWGVAYELGDTVVPSLSSAPVFAGIAPDIVFALAAGLLIARGLTGERGWALIGAGALCWAAGDIYWTLALASVSNPPLPSWADAGYLSFCPFAFAGILSLVRQRVSAAPRTLVADALAAAMAVGALSAAVVVKPVLAGARGGPLAVGTNLAYPLCDLLLLGLIVGATALGNWRLSRTWVLLAASVLAFWVADSFYLVTAANGTYQQNAWFNPLWYWSPVLAAWAAWLPRHGPAHEQTRAGGTRGILIPLGFTFGALAILIWSSFDRVGVPAVALASGSVLVVMYRLALTWRENARLLSESQSEALIDALTGLSNRRALTADLERHIAKLGAEHTFTLVMFDLDGFKHYNDSFGHPAGDALLQRLGWNLGSTIGRAGTAYRMGGDEFCALIGGTETSSEATVDTATAALSEHGEGFTIACSRGAVRLPAEAHDSENALRIADQRMYARKAAGGRSVARRQVHRLLRPDRHAEEPALPHKSAPAAPVSTRRRSRKPAQPAVREPS
jgi:diguanylate cyclase (GGDEF)-like protein